ncbi:uncharacterized protein LOC121887046 [Xyrichtys novacula]|uniref:Uncharacterized protein LOC121887046 n=1 Tax=Xyrichtys novacula TaxID=13765 RepID=A0AAV1H563_XYRNO|nr:uncharacterized protein LOC121887046 [Xyrichtys novacula]
METAGSSFQQQSAHKWTDENTKRLIRWRGRNEAVFTGRRNAALKGFEAFVKENELEGQVDPSFPPKKWENLKYKVLKAPPTGVSTEGGEATACHVHMTPAAVASPPNPTSESPPVRGRRTSDSRSREWFEE